MTGEALAGDVAAMMARHWRDEGFTAPNLVTYPWQWLWDSCFHSIIWAELGDERALVELRRVFVHQDELGFVPHMTYDASDLHAAFWGRAGSSCITQPPMYGHAAAELVRRHLPIDDELLERCRLGIDFLLRHRPRHASGLVALCHPWESGADDSPRWGDFCPGGFSPSAWFAAKGDLVRSIRFSDVAGRGAPLHNPSFDVASAGFNALVAFNARELASVLGDDQLRAEADELAALLDHQWDADLCTWTDAGASAAGSGRVRTADALLPVLVTDHADRTAAAFGELLGLDAYGGACGPAGVHRAEPAFDPKIYWRGPAWPQLTYLLWVAARRHGLGRVAGHLRDAAVLGADRSGLAEYWDPDDGTPLGAVPQSWTGLALVMQVAPPP